MYAQDSLFTLQPLAQLGVLALAFILSSLTIWTVWRVAPRFGWVAPLIAVALFWIYTWVSPQVFYQYFHLIFDGLPHQWVIWPPPGPARIFELVTFTGRPSLSAHGHGGLAWALIGVSIARNSLFRRNAAN